MTWVLALDQAQKCGWALGSTGGKQHHQSGVWNLPPPSIDGDETPLFVSMRKRLADLWERQQFQSILFEEPQFIEGKSPVGTRIQLIGLVAVIQLFAHDHDIPACSVDIGVWRKHFIGARYAPKHITVPDARTEWWKHKAIEACSRRMWDCNLDHNRAEALGILDYALWQADQNYEIQQRPIHERQHAEVHKEGAI